MLGTNCAYCGAFNHLGNHLGNHVGNHAAQQFCVACAEDLTLQPTFPGYDQTHEWEPLIDPNQPLTDIAPFGVDTAISETLSLFSTNFWLITKIVVVTIAPLELFRAFNFTGINDQLDWTAFSFVQSGVSKVLVVPALIYALMKIILTGQEPGVHESYRWGLTKFGKLCICAIILSALQWLGYALLVIPGIIVSLVFALVYPIAVLEKGSITEAFARSIELTRGHRIRILATWIVLGVPLIVFAILSSHTLEGAGFGPLMVIGGLLRAILDQALTILALVMYLSLPRPSAGDGGHTVLSLSK